MSTELERLRRRLYAEQADDADLVRYRRALDASSACAQEEEDLRPSVPARAVLPRRGKALLAVVGAAALTGLALVVAVLAGRPMTAPVRPPLAAVASAAGLTADLDVQRAIDRALAGQYSEQSGRAADRLDARIRRTLLPGASDGSALSSAGGRNDQGAVVLQPPSGRVVVARGDLLLLSVVTREPASSTWRVLGWRAGEPHRPHPILLVRSQAGGADRIAAALVRAPERMTVSSIRVAVSPRTPFLFRAEQHDAAAQSGARG